MDDEEEDDGPPVTAAARKRAADAVDTSRLAKLLTGLWLASMMRSYARVSDQVGVEVKPDPKSPAARRLTKIAADQIKAIEETTRARVADYVDRGIKDGLSIPKLAKLIASDPSGAFSRARATTIARTETAMAYAHGSVAGWRESGRVEKVIIHDGDGCGWSGHDDGDLADGSIRTLEEYEENPIAHPNCLRAASPYLGDD